MYELIVYYILPNVALFGGIYLLCKYVENATWNYIQNFDKLQPQIVAMRKQLGLK
jgi:hypothetical protein